LNRGISVPAAHLAIGAVAALLLVQLSHIEPGVRSLMARGERVGERPLWLDTLARVCGWGPEFVALAPAIRAQVRTRASRVGFVFIVAAGPDEALSSTLDINRQSLHDVAGFMAVLSLPVAAMWVSVHLSRGGPWSAAREVLLWTANLTWISSVVLFASLFVLFVTYTHSGGRAPADGKPLPLGPALPHGTTAFVGSANRFLVLAYGAWVIIVAWEGIKLQDKTALRQAASATPEELLR
jgi:hypothetical protein